MKKAFVLFIALLCAFTVMIAAAEDLSALTLEELTARRQQLIDELTQVNALRGSMIRQQVEEGVMPDDALGKIIDLFPDEELAKIIRDKCGKFSVEQTVTQDDLNKVEMLNCLYADVRNLAGIRYLANLKYFYIDAPYDGTFPEELRYCNALAQISLTDCKSVTAIPEWIGELTDLKRIDMYNDGLIQLPDSICSLANLEYLDLHGNKELVCLPDNIGNLTKLDKLYISGTAITALPDSIWNLTLSYLDMSGLPIR